MINTCIRDMKVNHFLYDIVLIKTEYNSNIRFQCKSWKVIFEYLIVIYDTITYSSVDFVLMASFKGYFE